MKKKLAFLLCMTLTLCSTSGAVLAAESEQDADPASALISAADMPPSVSAYPAEVRTSEENGVYHLEKVYYLTAKDDPSTIPTADFEREGRTYTLLDMLKNDQTETDTREHIEVVTLDSKTKDMAEILKMLEPKLEVKTEDGYEGILSLDHTTIQVEAAGYSTSSRTVTAERTYPNLSDADVSLIPKTVNENGRTLTLADVSWEEAATDPTDGYDIPIRYTAMASYSGTATSKYATGYTVTADYKGDVTRTSCDTVIYTAIFSSTGRAEVLPKTGSFNWMWVLAPLGVLALGGCGYAGYKGYKHYLTYNCLYPASHDLIEKLGVDGFLACTYDNMWYNGCYTITTYVNANEKVLTKNPLYWDTDCTLFDSVTYKMVESKDVAFQMFQAGEVDDITLTESNLHTIYDNPSNEYHDNLVESRPTKFSYQIHFCWDKYLENGEPDTNWNTAIANESFRKAWYYGLDLTPYLARTNYINPQNCANYAYTMSNLVSFSDGTEYTQRVMDKLGIKADGTSFARYDAAKADEYKSKAIEELTAKGVTFPVEIDYYIKASDQTALDNANVMKQMFSDCLGDDFVTFNIKTYVSSVAKEVRNPQLASFYVNAWGADYGDPQNFLGQETYGDDNAWYSTAYSKANNITDPELLAVYQKFTAMVEKASNTTDDMDARYEAYADAEAYMLDKVITLPLYKVVSWEMTHVNDYSKIYAPYGIQINKFKNWETSVDLYTTEDYAKLAAIYEANAAK